MASILALMVDEQEWTIAALAIQLGVSYGTIWTSIQALLAQGQIEERRRDVPSNQRFYCIEGAPIAEAIPQAPAIIEEDDEEHEAWLDRQHRSRATWWPVADAAVVNAMANMVRCGTRQDRGTLRHRLARGKPDMSSGQADAINIGLNHK